ncbi:ArsR/SmtB family transcription factor [Variovorax arabinosiphilus]|uniref:ArsR/SmtB family transcription factor n=1 Tax=Variovorax arabinosiphilus TaxID=3053498 RepID=UPI00257771D4|nr:MULTISPECIES: helix-turn-helix domain-containing protein [unclassified Variovorax]MDM0120108.1 helix-turn-helix domain-containing protein [Variovorax sp. J2L1-78]MDM0127979.1 helix-turn-helix domain-containing protein [Variovorax sp. J2L1-63]MDM0231679.1 helix-turn-helix domain-containing protein [Variovorax sp. J2R1-6]
MEASDAVKSLAALAQPVRLQVFRALVVAGPEGMTPGALVDAIAVPGTSLSFHLKELLHSGMVTQERSGRNLIYRAAFGRMSALIGYLTENCCEGEACAASTTVAPRG